MGSRRGETLSRTYGAPRAGGIRFRWRRRGIRGDYPELPPIRGGACAPGSVRTVAAAVFAGFLLVQTVDIIQVTRGTAGRSLALAVLLAVAVLQFAHSAPRARGFRSRYGVWTLTAQAALPLVPATVSGVHWAGMGGFAAGSALLILPARAAWVSFAAVVASVGVSAAGRTPAPDPFTVLHLVVAAGLTGMVVYSLTRLAELVGASHAARAEPARMAVARERMRFSRDLHDLLGYSLSSVVLKSELAGRLIRNDPGRAESEVAGVLGISRQALSDIRLVARSYREMSLAAEAESARTLLEAGGVEARLRLSCGELSPCANTVLATVLREGVANLLRHSRVRRCSIEVEERDSRVRLTLVNDGVAARDHGARTGSGAPAPARETARDGHSGAGNSGAGHGQNGHSGNGAEAQGPGNGPGNRQGPNGNGPNGNGSNGNGSNRYGGDGYGRDAYGRDGNRAGSADGDRAAATGPAPRSAGAHGPDPHGGGTGIVSLTARVTALGGRLTAGRGEAGTFHLVAEIPVAAREPEQGDPAVA